MEFFLDLSQAGEALESSHSAQDDSVLGDWQT
jgi:hypothetical protein